MATNSAESSSDLERAREVSRRLRPGGATAPPSAVTTGPLPTRLGFSAERARALAGGTAPMAAAPHAAAPIPAAPPAPPNPSAELPVAAARPSAPPARPTIPEPPADASWESLLVWCRSALAAEGAFVIDGRGLLVSNSGKLTDDDAQAMGARLVMTVDQADEMERGAQVRTLTLDLSTRCLTGVRLQLASGARLTVGVLSLRPLTLSAGALVRRAFASKLAEG